MILQCHITVASWGLEKFHCDKGEDTCSNEILELKNLWTLQKWKGSKYLSTFWSNLFQELAFGYDENL